MPFDSGEDVSLRFAATDPASASLEFLGRRYTLENHGLTLRRKDAVTALVRLPREPGTYSYTWTDGNMTEAGQIRVRATAPPPPPPEAAQPDTGGVKARRR